MIGLPALPPLAGEQSPATDYSSVTGSISKVLTGASIAGPIGAITAGAAVAVDKATGGKSGLPSLQSIVVILIGLLLIAAGIFSFREVRQTVIETGKTAVKAAAL